MDYHDLEEAVEKMEVLSERYAESRAKSTEAKLKFDYILASRLPEFMRLKKNIGYDTARLLLLSEQDDEVKEYDRSYHTNEAGYKGLEKILEAIREKVQLGKKLVSIE